MSLELTGVEVGSPAWISTPLAAQTLQINSADDAIKIDNNATINVGSGDFTVSFWFFLTQDFNGRWRTLMRKSTDDNTRTFALWLHPDSNRVHFRISTSGQSNDGGDSIRALTANQWTHITYVKQANTLGLYINGALDQQVNLQSSVIDNTGPLYIGASPWNPAALGNFHQVNVYPRSLTATEIEKLYQPEVTEAPPFNAVTETVISNLEHNGTPLGTPAWISTPLAAQTLQINSPDDAITQQNRTAFNVGNGDFAVSFWFYLTQDFNGTWRSLMRKGTDDSTRTFALWLHPDSNRVHFRISTSGQWNDGGDSVRALTRNQWTHIAYVKKANTLSLYLNGVLDQQVNLQGAVIDNDGPIYIGASLWNQAALGNFHQVNFYPRTLSGLEIDSQYQQAVPPSDLEESAQPSGTPSLLPSAKGFGQTLQINSLDDGALLEHASIFAKGNQDFSVAFWLKLEAGANDTWRALMHKGSNYDVRTFGLWLRPNDNRLHYRISTTADWNEGGDSQNPIALNQWTQVVYVKQGDQLHLYLNGVLDSSAPLNGAVLNNSDPLYIGKNPWAPPAFAQFDNIRLFHRSLKAEDVARLYQSQPLAPNIGGQWGEIMPWPHIAVSAANLPDGRLLTWSGSERTITPSTERTYSATWNPSNQQFLEMVHDSHNMFCAHLAMTDDGKVFANGGNNSQNSPWTSLFDFRDNQWTQVENMATGGRWYPTTLALPTGEMLTAMGTASNVANPEKWSANKGWQVLNGIDFLTMRQNKAGTEGQHIWWPLLSVAPTGEVFHFWTPQDTFWINTQGTGQARAANAQLTNSANSPATPTSPDALAPGVAIQYDVGKMLISGNNQGSWGDFTTRAQTFTVDLNGPTPVISSATPMHFARAYHNAVVLPTGEVLVVGGNTSAQGFSDEGTIYDTEIWNPNTRQWRLAAASEVPRNYHSVALLLTDGRVFSAGGGYCGGDELCNNASHQNAQIYSPSYLFNADGSAATRPTISNSPGFIQAGQSFAVNASADTTRFTLIKMSATTHAVNTDTRFSDIPFVQSAPGQFTLTTPANPNVLIPGYWMLFALNANNVPSVAKVIRVQPLMTVSTPGPNRYVKLIAQTEVSGNTFASVAELNLLDGNGNPIDRSRWVISSDSANRNHAATFALDDQTNTFWSSEFTVVVGRPIPSHPHQLLIDLGASYALSGLTYLPRQDASAGRIANYEVWLSGDGQNWQPVKSGSFVNNSALQTANFSTDIDALTLSTPTPSVANQAMNFAFNASQSLPSGLQYKWSFGDGSPETAFSNSAISTHTFQNPGLFIVVATVRDPITGVERSLTQSRIVYEAGIDLTRPIASFSSSSMQFHPQRAQVWAVNTDNNSVSVFDSVNFSKQAEIPVGIKPSALAFASNGDVWVSNKTSASISVIDALTLKVKSTIALPNKNSRPHGLIIHQSLAFVALEASNQVVKINTSTGQITQTKTVLNQPRHLAKSVDGNTLYVNAFITPPVLNEHTAAPDVRSGVASVMLLRTTDLVTLQTVNLQHSNAPTTENTGPGIPNYLGALALHPLGHSAYLPSKQDNILAGGVRGGAGMNFDQTVRAISSKLNLITPQERLNQRIQHDNASVASAAIYDAYGLFLFTTLEGNRQVAVSNTLTGSELLRLNVGRAPQALALSPNGRTLAVHNVLDRSVQFFDLSALMDTGELNLPSLAVTSSVAQEALPATILRGKQLFYDASDDRLAALGYMSCASCHSDGDGDGRTWDMTQFGEGLRNTISLRGKGGMAHGRLHWSGNFDEVQDFEAQIRDFAGGRGLMNDSDFAISNTPLGTPKAGRSADLDALSAYVSSLTQADIGPLSQAAGLSTTAAQGKLLLQQKNCASCHQLPTHTDSISAVRHDIGTQNAASGSRLFAPLDGLDTPTLLGLASSAPYLHNGSAKTLQAAIAAHTAVVTTTAERNAMARYLLELK